MAMIKCPDCGKEISDKTKECIHCGCPIGAKEIKEAEKIDINVRKIQTKKKIITIIISTILIVGLFIGGVFCVKHIIDERRKNELETKTEKYKDDLETISVEMLSGAAKSEECGNLIKKVWYNSIWEENDKETNKFTKKNGKFNEDFNDSLKTLFEDSDFKKNIEEIKANKETVANLMKKMKNPPDGMEEAYIQLKDYYDNYVTLVNLCISPSGNLNSYSSKFNDADTEAVESYEKMKSYYED